MAFFSERYGYIKPSDALIIECMPQEVVNAIYNCFKSLYRNHYLVCKIQRDACAYFFNDKIDGFSSTSFHDVITPYILDSNVIWHKKLSLIEFIIDYIIKNNYPEYANYFIAELNDNFERLNYGYRIINNFVTPITSKEEVGTIEEAINNAKNNIKEHLNSALKHLADKENPDYRNSIKESISAVGALCREMTGENDLRKALSSLEKKHGNFHPQLKESFCKLYDYVNEKQSGVRHELMDESGKYVPTYHEAKFMLVTCSAFINYLNGKFK